MSTDFIINDENIQFLTLNYATRLLSSQTDLNSFVKISLSTLADFAKSRHIEFAALESDDGTARVLGRLENGKTVMHDEVIRLGDSIMAECMRLMRPVLANIDKNFDRLCLPLVGSNTKALGFVSIDIDTGKPLKDIENQVLIILSTLIAMSLEHLRYYRLAMYDGLTGLFVRREFDEKLVEEMNRVKRYQGNLSIFIVDIDHFKLVNDKYGHLQGDRVLQELSGLVRESIREGVDVPCRYGGEELVVILPNTGLDGAYLVAERFRKKCENYKFTGQSKPLKVTVSGGVAAIDGKSKLTKNELIEQADSMLYKAKDDGRNLIYAWGAKD